MHIGHFISNSRIIDLKGESFAEALEELLEVCNPTLPEGYSKKKLYDALIAQELTMSTYLGRGLALPHLRLQMHQPYLFAIGRCRNGLTKEPKDGYREARLVFLLLSSVEEKPYLNTLATLARIFQNSSLLESDYLNVSLKDFRQRVSSVFRKQSERIVSRENQFNQLLLKETAKISRHGKCSAVFIFSDTFTQPFDWARYLKGFRVILVTQKATEVTSKGTHSTIPVRLFSQNRLSQLRSAIIIALTHGLISSEDRLCCVGGLPNSDHLDSLVVVEVRREVQAVFGQKTDLLPECVRPEVFERLLGIVTELAVEGREGRPVGGLFVIGNIAEIKPHVKPLVLNPFFGYREEDRNLLNPFMDETIKEYSSLDGAFIISGDGLLESAGSMIYAPQESIELPSGLGTRHSAAAAISMAVDCIAVTISASTGQVTLFRRGQMMPLM